MGKDVYQKPKLLLHLSNKFNSRLPASPIAKECSGIFLLLEKREIRGGAYRHILYFPNIGLEEFIS